MGLLFKKDFHDDFGTWPLSYIPYGGADIGEIQAIAVAVGDGNDDDYYEAWMAAAHRFENEANEALNKNRKDSARELFLKASEFYATSYHPIYGSPVDPRIVKAFRKNVETFDKAMALSKTPVKPFRIPFEGTSFPAYFIPATDYPNDIRPLIIFINGYDGTITDMYFASAVAASNRGYHCLLFDGPGQGEMLIEHTLPLRADWENVVKAVVDIAITLPFVDVDRIAVNGWSLGGYLAPRAASGEHRIAACIADPGQPGLADFFRRAAIKFLGASPDEVADLGNISDELLEKLWSMITNNRKLAWSIVQRGFWVNGVQNLRDYLRSAETFTLVDRATLIQCPTLLTIAENDPLTVDTRSLYDVLVCPKTLIKFTADRGAGNHCEMGNRSLLNRLTLDWLDDVFF
ncbi:MAG TPA: alpha/beta fold hydrolase [Mucilaginibacter sp.]|jgi:pimeloyl-ACP methyl ester carboxylesterase